MGEEYPKFKVAAVQASPVFLDRDATVKKACALIEEAGKNGAKLVVFPETWIPTYPYWIVSTSESPMIFGLQRKAFTRLFKNSVEIPSPATDALCQAARKAGVYVVMGLNERDSEYGRGTIYNTLLYIDKNGRIMGKHRKLIPTGSERTIWGRGDGSGLLVLDTGLGRLGGLICWENHMPLARYTMYSKGERIHAAVWPTGSGGKFTCRQIAFEGNCFVISVGAYIDKDLVPDDFEMKEETIWEFWRDDKGSAIVSPKGDYLAGPMPWEEGILYAEVDLDWVVSRKHMLDVVGHYSRPDVFKLFVNEEKLVPMTTTKGEGEGELKLVIDELIGKVGRIPTEDLKKELEELKRLVSSR